jgi:RHS repeat-associated protein
MKIASSGSSFFSFIGACFTAVLLFPLSAQAGQLLQESRWQTPVELSHWTPFSAGVADLNPVDDYRGILMSQALNVANPGGKDFTFSVEISREAADIGNAVSFDVEFIDNNGVRQRERLLPVSNTEAPQGAWSKPTRVWRCPTEATRLTRIHVLREDAGHLRMRNPNLTHASLVNDSMPVIHKISPDKGAYGWSTVVTITGANFGAKKGTVMFAKPGMDESSWSQLSSESVYVNEWSDTSITFTPLEPNSGGRVVVFTADGVSTQENLTFEVTSPHFTLRNLTPRQSVFQGEPLVFDVELKLSPGNPGYQNGIALAWRGTSDEVCTIEPETVYPDASNPVATFKVTVDTSTLDPGTYGGSDWYVQTMEDRSYARRLALGANIVARSGTSLLSGARPFDSAGENSAMGLPQPRVDLAALDLIMESTLFRMKTLGPPVAINLMFAEKADAVLGFFGKGWRMSYESSISQRENGVSIITTKGELRFTGSGLDQASETVPVTLTPPKGNYDSLTCYGLWFEYVEKDTKLRYRYQKATLASTKAWLVKITDRNAQQLTIATNTTTGRISSIKDAANRTFTFQYNGDGLCTKIIAPDSRYYQFHYLQGRISAIRDPDNHQANYAYDRSGYLTSSGLDGKQFRFTYAERAGGNGRKYVQIMQDSANRQTRYAFKEGKNNVVRVTDGSGNVREITTQAGRPATRIGPSGELSLIGYNNDLPVFLMDENGGTTRVVYDERGNVLKVTDELGKTSEMAYDEHDNLTSHKNALGRIWSYEYDAKGNLIVVNDPLGRRTRIARDARGRIQSATDAMGNTVRYAYDSWGNLSSITDALGQKSRFEYTSPGMRLRKVVDAAGDYKLFTYDGLDRVTTVAYHNSAGALLASLAQEWSAYGAMAYTNELGHTSRVERNGLGQILKQIDPLGAETALTYDTSGNHIRTTDPLSRVFRNEYDESNRLIATVNPMDQTVRRSYDPAGRLTELRDAKGNRTLWVYDKKGNVIRMQDTAGKTVRSQYDALNRPTRRFNARGQEILFAYDWVGNRTGVTYKDADLQYRYVYDALNRLSSMTGPDGTTTYAYTARGELAKVIYPNSAQISFEYDAVGNLDRIVYPDGLVVNYDYDAFNRVVPPHYLRNTSRELMRLDEPAKKPVKISWNGGGVDVTYNAASLPALIDRANGVDTVISYDQANRVTGISHVKGAQTIEGITTAYNPAGLVIAQTFTGSVLMPASDVSNAGYNNLNQISTWDGKAYVHDADGNLTAATGRYSAEYDPENRLTSLLFQNGRRVNYSYNGLGHRVKSTDNGVDRHFLYDNRGQLLCVMDGNAKVVRNIIYSGASILALGTAATGYSYPLFDMTGNVTALLNSAGQVKASYRYLPFGRMEVTGTPGDNPFTYSGIFGVQHQGEGLYAMGQRFYDASISRFLHRDPLGIAGGINLYAYADNSPVLLSDPRGEVPWPALLAAAWLGSKIYNAYGAYKHGKDAAKKAGETLDELKKTGDSFADTERRAKRLKNLNDRAPSGLEDMINLEYNGRIPARRDSFNSLVDSKDSARDATSTAAEAVYHTGRAAMGVAGFGSNPADAAGRVGEMAADAAWNEVDRHVIEE